MRNQKLAPWRQCRLSNLQQTNLCMSHRGKSVDPPKLRSCQSVWPQRKAWRTQHWNHSMPGQKRLLDMHVINDRISFCCCDNGAIPNHGCCSTSDKMRSGLTKAWIRLHKPFFISWVVLMMLRAVCPTLHSNWNSCEPWIPSSRSTENVTDAKTLSPICTGVPFAAKYLPDTSWPRETLR